VLAGVAGDSLVQSEEPASGRQRKLIIVAAVIFVVAGGVAWYMLRGKTAADMAAVRIYMCSETGKAFEHKIREGEEEPIESPYTGKRTAYIPEACYWTKGPDGQWKAKLTPTYVILESRLHPGTRKKTICPDCGKEVRGHNPMPSQELMQAAKGDAATGKKE
jgi:hypothetical protein